MKSEILNKEIEVKINHVGLIVKDDWLCDHWMFSANGESSDYFTGIGHRKRRTALAGYRTAPNLVKAAFDNRIYDKAAQEKIIKENSSLQAPKVDDILYSLVMDADACNYSFEDWCCNYGYDEDSRKALETYLACQKSEKTLRAMVKDMSLAEIQEAFQDY